MSAEEKQVLAHAAAFELPEGAQQRVFDRIKGSIAARPAPVSPAGLGVKRVVLLGGTMLAAGILLGRTVFAPPAEIVERVVRVEVPAPLVQTIVRPPEKKEPAPQRADALLAQERELVDTARSALLHGDGAAALLPLEAHARKFPHGRLDEERESLWVQALVMKDLLPAARARAAQFHQKFPRSLLGPTVDAAVSEP